MTLKIYHYTSIDSLALILKNRTLRFTRLDHVDDLEEAKVEQSQYDLAKFLFVSCWTENGEESIPLWKMYSGGATGVRIGVEKEMFQGYFYFSFDEKTGELKDIQQTLVPDDHKKDFFVLPVFDCNKAPFYRKVDYKDDLVEATKGIVKEESKVREVRPDGSKVLEVTMSLDLNRLGAIKHSRWEFQDESRFSLFIVPGNPFTRSIETATSAMIYCLKNGKSVPFEYYDLPLAPKFFESLEVTLSPNASESQRIIVESLCSSLAPGAVIRESSLKGKVVMK